MGKDKTKEKERHRMIRRNKKERLTKLETLKTYLEKYHSGILEEFEEFYESSKTVNPTPVEKPPLLDNVKLKDDLTIESLPEQDANLKLPAPNDFLQDLEWDDDIVWDDSLSESTNFDINQFLDTVLK